MTKKHHLISTFSLNGQPFFFWFDLILIFVLLAVLGIDFFRLSAKRWDLVILIAASLIGLAPVIFNAFKALITRRLTIDLLASIALIFSLLAQEWRSAVFISLMLASARLFTRYTSNQAKRSIQSLLKLRPSKAHLKFDGQIIEVRIENLKKGDLVVAEAGERIAVDGIVEQGEASVDESSLTGESIPVTKKMEDEVFSSTLNLSGSLVIRATRVGADTTFSKILELVEKSQTNKAPIASIVDSFTSWYILATLIGAGIIYFFTHNLILVLAILLVTCADDLAVAVPLAFSAAIAIAAKRRGIIIKGGNFLEGLSKTKIMVFDKTGTITQGQPQVQEIITFHNYPPEKFLIWIGAAESESSHPTAKAIQKLIAQKNIKIPSITYTHEEPGFGMRGNIDGKEILAGKAKFLEDNGVEFSDEALKIIEEQKTKRRTLTILAVNKELLGFVSFSDAIRPNAFETFSKIKKLGIEKTVMLTGDNEIVAQEVAQKVGIDEFKANLLPQDKINFLKNLLNPKYKVAMVGDGVNDAAALALADIGLAMGSIGSDAAIESADIVLMKDNLLNLPDAMNLGRYSMKIIRQDLVIWAMANLAGLVLVFMGVLGPSGAAAFNFLTDFLPLFNSLRIFKYRF